MSELTINKVTNRRISDSVNLVSPSAFKDSLNKASHFDSMTKSPAFSPRSTAGFNRKLTEPGMKYFQGADNARNRNSG